MGYISALTTKNEVVVWERSPSGERLTKSYTPEYYFYVDDPDGTYTTIYDTPVSRITCKNAFDLKNKVAAFKQNDIRTWESDIPAEMRVLSNHYYNADVPKLNITFLDIEVDYDKTIGFSGIYNPYAPINSVSLLHYNTKQLLVFCVPPDNLWTNERLSTEVNRDVPIPSTYDTHIHVCENECELLTLMLDAIKDSDIVCGWNSEFFDFPYIHRRIEISLGKASLRHLSFPKAATMNLQEKEVPRYGVDTKTLKLDVVGAGRLYADYMELYRKYEFGERSSYKLEAISDIVLVDADDNPILPKLHYKKTLYELYREDFAFFIRYNIRDVEILAGFEDVLSYVELSNQMYHRSTAQYQHVSGTLKLAEYAIINYCHHVAKRVVPDCEVPTIDAQISGALVLEPKIGVHDRFGAIDLNSLYPSGIRSINISPETIRGQFEETLTAVQHIINAYIQQDDTPLTLRLENGERIEATASEWRVWLLEHHWSISGYGTVFDQAKQGIIPAVLADWYATRKSFQAKSKEAPTPAEHDYYDRLQYVYKIKLNSLYGALTNLYFRFYDLRMGESTTCTGRLILQHQCAKTNEVLTTKYDMHGDAVIYGDSVSGDTTIETTTGPICISDLFTTTDYTLGDREYCNVDCDALTYDVTSNTTVFKPIKYVVRHLVTKQMYRVWITNSQYIDVTEDHALITYANTKYRKQHHTNLILRESTPIDLLQGGSLIYQKTLPTTNTPSTHPSHLLLLAGLIMGDGYVDTTVTGGVLLSVGSQDICIIEQEVLQPLQKQGWISSWYIKPNGHDIQISSVRLRKLLREWLYCTGVKRTPAWMFTHEYRSHYLRGWFSADGWVNKNNTIGITNIHAHNIQDIHRLLLSTGVSSTWCTETTENSFEGVFSGTFSKRLTVKSTNDFISRINFIQPRKRDRCKNTTSTRERAVTGVDFKLVTPTKIELLPTTEARYVYDIEVGDTHMFFANNILVHNTDSTYFHTFADNNEDAIKIADYVAAQVNASYPEFMRNTFLCNTGFDHIIKAGREIVASRGIFVQKKRYILHVIDKEGTRVDTLKVMGLDTKKTNLPSGVGDTLNNFVARYLKGESWKSIAQSIVDYKNALRYSQNIMDIGLPKGIKNVDKYSVIYRTQGKDARLPGHVAAAIHYNECLEKYQDKDSTPITSGMKIKVFYLKGNHGKFKSIAIPTDNQYPPPWFDNFEVDVEAHILRLVDNPLTNIIKAIGEQVPSQHTIQVQTAWEF